MKISLAMIVKDEEKNIKECLKKVENIVDEMIIVDTGSKDDTIKIAEEFGAKIYEFKWCDDFSAARNFASEKATGDWILVLDADEFVSIGDRITLEEFVKNNENTIGRIEQHNKYINRDGISYSSEYISRFYPRGLIFKGLVHEQLDTQMKREKINFRVEHNGYYKTNKSRRNIPLLFKMLEKNADDPYVLYQIGKSFYVDKMYIKAQIYYKKSYMIIKHEDDVVYKKNVVIDYIYSIINGNLNYEEGLKIINEQKNKFDCDADFNFVCGVFYLNLIISNEKKYIYLLPLIEKAYLKCINIGENNILVEGVGSYRAEYNLGTYYEVTGNLQLAYKYYQKSAQKLFKPAQKRIKLIKEM